MKALSVFFFINLLGSSSWGQVPEGFVNIADLEPMSVELRYFSDWNFVGRVIDGYEANKCFLSKEAAQALILVQKDLLRQGYSLLLFDCYRPQRAVNEFVSWTKNSQDLKMQKMFYPEEPKAHLIKRGYIASRSGHSRGSTVDLTLMEVAKMKLNSSAAPSPLLYKEEFMDCRGHKTVAETGQLDMGTSYDCFSNQSNTDHKDISEEAQKNRRLLKRAMEKQGFENYSKEWWHFTLKNEPFKKDYFDFVIK